jgi:hypothetical protein
LALVLAGAAFGCNADDTAVTGLCTETMVAGQSAECVCGNDRRGVQTCQDDGTLTVCTCVPINANMGDAGQSGDGDGGRGSDAMGGDGDAMPGDGDAAAMPGDGDGDHGHGDGDAIGGDGDGDAETGIAPTDGEQLSFCETIRDCNQGLICYVPGHYCTGDCMQDADCGPDDSGYRCAGAFDPMMSGFRPIPGICRLDCAGPDDDSCPEGMACMDIGSGNFNDGELTFRCGYTEEAAPPGTMDTPAFQPCDSDGDCVEGLACVGGLDLGGFPFPGFGSGVNFCTQRCSGPEQCTAEPSTGSAPVDCVRFDFGGQVMTSGGTCELDCRRPDVRCPDGMECIVLSMGGSGGVAICDYLQ